MSDGVEKTKRPASQYYWGDWWKDKGLHSCSLTARGLWHEMNCLMHEGEPYGHLTLNGKPMTNAQLANQSRITPGKCKVLVEELESAGVFSRDASLGTIFSRRMVRDERIRNARAAGGKDGAEHGAKGASHGDKGGRPTSAKGGSETPLSGGEKPPPSSSSSSSPSGDSEGKPSDGKPSSASPAGELPGVPPAPAAPANDDPLKAEIWRTGRKLLTDADMPKGKAGSFIGKLVVDYGQPIVLDAVRAAARAAPPEPSEYLVATCKRMAGERKKNADGADWTRSAE